ncbi:MAG: DUF4139 domain-containing protein [Candidatus Micrarchaeota archaeon]|nr:DUF4139 domain-containing protein [Candidatus Micrarchaeota archaeon]
MYIGMLENTFFDISKRLLIGFLILFVGLTFAQATQASSSYPEIEIRELFLFKDSYVISYDTKPGIYLLFPDDLVEKGTPYTTAYVYPKPNTNPYFFILGSGSVDIQESKKNELKSYDLATFLNKRVEVNLFNGTKMVGILSKLPSENNPVLILAKENSLDFVIIPYSQVVSLKPLEIKDNMNKTVTTIKIDGQINKLLAIPNDMIDTSIGCIYCDMQSYYYKTINVLDLDKKEIETTVNFVNTFGKIKNAKVTFFTYSFDSSSIYRRIYPYAREATKRTVTSVGYSQESTSETTSAEIDSENAYSTTLQESEFGKAHVIRLVKDSVDIKPFKYIWNSQREDAIYEYLELKTKSTTLPQGSLVILKQGLPYTKIETKPIYDKEFTEIKLKADPSISVKREYNSRSNYDPNGRVTSYDYSVELTIQNNGRTERSITVREHVSYYGFTSYQVLSVDGVSDYNKEIDKISFDLKLKPGEKKKVTLNYRVYI